jgi:uncharacterized protein
LIELKAEYYINLLNLQKHPEGGYYREVYRSEENYPAPGLPDRYSGSRSFATSIYFLLTGKDISRFHKLKSDEIWHHYEGCSVRIYILDELGNLSEIRLGKNISSGEVLQAVISKDNWFAAEPADSDSFSLIGCSVSPGFEFDDFEIGKRDDLIKLFPRHENLIVKFTGS